MKKIISLFALIATVCCFGTVVFAANEAPFSFTPATVNVAQGEGSTDVEMTLAMTLTEEVQSTSLCVQLIYDAEKISVKSMDETGFSSIIPYQASWSMVDSGMMYFMGDMGGAYTIPAGTYNIPIVLTVDNTTVAEYTVTLDAQTMLADAAGLEAINDLVTYPTATITVAKAAPALPEVDIDSETEEYTDGSGKFTQGFLATVVAGDTPISAINFNLTRTSDGRTDVIVGNLPASVKGATVKVAVNILNVDAGVEITATGTAVAAATN